MEEKICVSCSIKKAVNEFPIVKRKVDRSPIYRKICKSCYRLVKDKERHSFKGMLANIYKEQVDSSKDRGHNLPEYTAKEFYEFANQFSELQVLYDNWVNSKFNLDLRPTFDRTDDSKGYSFDNFNHWMTFRENYMKRIETLKKPVIGLHTVSNECLIFGSITDAAIATNMSKSNLSLCLNGLQPTAGGYYWQKISKEQYEKYKNNPNKFYRRATIM